MIFETNESRFEEAEEMWRDNHDLRHNRDIVSRFYNGGEPVDPCEMDRLGLTRNINYLTGYTVLDQALSELSAPLHDARIFNVMRCEGGGHMRSPQDRAVSRTFSKVINRNGAFRKAMMGMLGDVTLHGHGVLHWESDDAIYPEHIELDRVLIPKGVYGCEEDLTHFVIIKRLSMTTLQKSLDSGGKAWKKDAIKKILGEIEEKDGMRPGTRVAQSDPILMEGEDLSSERGRNPDFYYFYERDEDKIALRIFLRSRIVNGQSDSSHGVMIYENEEAYSNSMQAMIPVVLDFRLGGNLTWHRVMGLGTLNYAVDEELEYLNNRIMEATDNGMHVVWQAQDMADYQAADKLCVGNHTVLPPGVNLLERRNLPRIGDASQVVSYLSSLRSTNARQHSSNVGGNSDELEVQALMRQRENIASRSNRMSDFLNHCDRIGREIFRRMMVQISHSDEEKKVSSDAARLRSSIVSQGLSVKDFDPGNVDVEMNRVGNGMSIRDAQRYDHLLSTMGMRSPEERRQALLEIDAIGVGDDHIIDKVNQFEQRESASDRDSALLRLSAASEFGLLIEPEPGDNNMLHASTAVALLEGYIAKAIEDGAIYPSETKGAQAIAAYAAAHASILASRGSEAEAAQINERVAQFASAWESLEAELLQEPGGQMDPELQLKIREQDRREVETALREQKQGLQEAHRQRSQENRERMGAAQMALQEAQLQLQREGQSIKHLKVATDLMNKIAESETL